MAVSRAALSREIAEHPGRPIWAATGTTSGDLICWAWRRLRGSSPVASGVRYSRFGWVYVHWFGHGLRARVSAETLLANAWRNCSGRSVVSAGFTRFRWALWNIGPVVTGPMFHRADGGPVGGRHGGGGCGARDWGCSWLGPEGAPVSCPARGPDLWQGMRDERSSAERRRAGEECAGRLRRAAVAPGAGHGPPPSPRS